MSDSWNRVVVLFSTGVGKAVMLAVTCVPFPIVCAALHVCVAQHRLEERPRGAEGPLASRSVGRLGRGARVAPIWPNGCSQGPAYTSSYRETIFHNLFGTKTRRILTDRRGLIAALGHLPIHDLRNLLAAGTENPAGEGGLLLDLARCLGDRDGA